MIDGMIFLRAPANVKRQLLIRELSGM